MIIYFINIPKHELRAYIFIHIFQNLLFITILIQKLQHVTDHLPNLPFQRRVRRVDEALAGSSTAVDTPEMLPDQSSSTSSGQGLKSTARKSRGKPTNKTCGLCRSTQSIRLERRNNSNGIKNKFMNKSDLNIKYC